MNRYAILLGLIALTASTTARPGREEDHAMMKKCADEAGLDPEMFKGPPPKETPIDLKMGCFVACIMKQNGELNEDGTVNTEKLIEHLPPNLPNREKLIAAMTECDTLIGKDKCETAQKRMECMHHEKGIPVRQFGPGPK